LVRCAQHDRGEGCGERSARRGSRVGGKALNGKRCSRSVEHGLA